ncbi:hypothetical protein [Pseudodesulfovibrio nedwellii]|nr:hypothetical protein [Pseudodesulfovibrio nedwellii]
MKNALEKYRTDNKLTFEALGHLVDYPRGTVHKHCHAQIIPGDAAIRYHRKLGIPLDVLHPDPLKAA